jgi:hypothetical protein
MQLHTHENKAIRSACTPDVTAHAPARDYIAAITLVERQDVPTSLNPDPITVLHTAPQAAITAILTVRPAKRKAARPAKRKVARPAKRKATPLARRNPIHITYMIMMM